MLKWLLRRKETTESRLGGACLSVFPGKLSRPFSPSASDSAMPNGRFAHGEPHGSFEPASRHGGTTPATGRLEMRYHRAERERGAGKKKCCTAKGRKRLLLSQRSSVFSFLSCVTQWAACARLHGEASRVTPRPHLMR
jgi:hypothetical protein